MPSVIPYTSLGIKAGTTGTTFDYERRKLGLQLGADLTDDQFVGLLLKHWKETGSARVGTKLSGKSV